jgi:DNA-binding SARP family transcriptional activator
MLTGVSGPPDPPALELRCFGAPTARVAGQPAPPEVLWRKHLALLIYLALSPGRSRTREHLLGVLWPEKNQTYARHSLNQAVALLRSRLGAARLLSEGDSLTLSGAGLEVDAERLDAAATTVSGEFLEGFALDDAPAFEEWAGTARTRWRQRAAAVLTAAGETALASFRYADAIALARRALAYEPYGEAGVRLLMRAAALSGDIAGALAAFRDFSARLKEQLGEQPSRSLEELAERVRSMRWRRSTAIWYAEEPPLVGRDALHREAFALVEAGLRAGPRTLLVTGDPGAGRTRLLVECGERLALGGAVLVAARPLESDRDAAWSTVRALLRAGLLRAPGSAGIDPRARAVLAALDDSGDAPRDAAELAAALAALLEAVAEEQPIGISIDDAHCSDGPSLGVLEAAMGRLRHMPVVLCVTALDAWESAPRELVRLRAAVGRGLPGTALRLEPLSESETQALLLASSPWCKTDVDRERLARRMFFETRGNPFLLVTLLRGLAEASTLREEVLRWPPPRDTIDAPLPIGVPGLARRAIMARVTDLAPEVAQVLRMACIGTPVIDPALVAALVGRPLVEVERDLAALEHRHFVTFDGERYGVAAPLIAAVVGSECLEPGECRALRSRAIEWLATRNDPGSQRLRANLLALIAAGVSG